MSNSDPRLSPLRWTRPSRHLPGKAIDLVAPQSKELIEALQDAVEKEVDIVFREADLNSVKADGPTGPAMVRSDDPWSDLKALMDRIRQD